MRARVCAMVGKTDQEDFIGLHTPSRVGASPGFTTEWQCKHALKAAQWTRRHAGKD